MDLVSGKVYQGCSNAANPFHECTAICFERLSSGDVPRKEKKLFGFVMRSHTPPGSPARAVPGNRSPLASYFGKKKVESDDSPSSDDHNNANFLSRLSPLQGAHSPQPKYLPGNNVVDSLPMSPSLAGYSGGDYFASRPDYRGGEPSSIHKDADADMSPRPYTTRPKTPEHPLRTPQHRPRTPDARPRTSQHHSSSSDTRPRTSEHRSTTPNTRPRTPEHRSTNPDTRPRTPEHRSSTSTARPRTPEHRHTHPDTRPRTPEHRSSTSNTTPRTPEYRHANPDTRPRTPEHRSSTSNTRPRTPEHRHANPDTRPRTPEHRSSSSDSRPRTPEHRFTISNTRPVAPQQDPVSLETRPWTPERRPKTPEQQFDTSDTRPRMPKYESAARETSPQTPDDGPRAADQRGRSPEYMARSPGPRSKTPEPQATYFEPLAATPKLQSRTSEPIPRMPQVQPITHKSLDSGLQMPHTAGNRPKTPVHQSNAKTTTPGTRPRTPEHQSRTVEARHIINESRPKTAEYRARSPDHRERPAGQRPRTPETTSRIPQTQQTSFEDIGQRSPQRYNYRGDIPESVYTDNDDESVLLYPELILSPQERPASRPITPYRNGHETPTKHEENFDQLDDSMSTDDDNFSFVDDQDDNSVLLFPEITDTKPKSGSNTHVHHKSDKSPGKQEEQDKQNNEPPKLPDESQSFSLVEISCMKGIKNNETREEMKSIISESYVSVGDYKVRASISATLQNILDKHGDIASNSKLKSLSTRSYYLDMLASVVFELQTTPLRHLSESRVVEMLAIVKDVESVKIKAGWLKQVLEEITEAVKLYNQHKMTIMEKEVWEGDSLRARQEMEKRVKDLTEKEKEMKERRERMTEISGKLGNLDMRRARLDKSLAFLSSKVDKFQGKFVLGDIL